MGGEDDNDDDDDDDEAWPLLSTYVTLPSTPPWHISTRPKHLSLLNYHYWQSWEH